MAAVPDGFVCRPGLLVDAEEQALCRCSRGSRSKALRMRGLELT
jgi:hypothetical protein